MLAKWMVSDYHDRRPTSSSARLFLSIMLRRSTGQSCRLSHVRSSGPMLDENQLIMLNNDVTKECEKSVTAPVPMPDEHVVILYSFRGTGVAMGKWLRASTQVFGQMVCNILKFHS